MKKIGKIWMDLGCIFEVSSITFANELVVGSELKKEIQKNGWFGS